MNQWMVIAYGILLGINALTLLLLTSHMRKFRRLNRNFLAVVQNVQAYLDAVMDEPEEEAETEMKAENEMRSGWEDACWTEEENGWKNTYRAKEENGWENAYRKAADKRQAEELLGTVLGEIFS